MQKKKGIGLYSYEQQRYESLITYFGQILVGGIMAVVGAALLYQAIAMRREQIQHYGFAETSFWDWFRAIALIVAGAGISHAGVIFYTRRIYKAIFRRRLSEE